MQDTRPNDEINLQQVYCCHTSTMLFPYFFNTPDNPEIATRLKILSYLQRDEIKPGTTLFLAPVG